MLIRLHTIALFTACLALSAAKGFADEVAPAKYTQAIPGTKTTFDMAPLSAGRFTLGSPELEKGRGSDEGPRGELQIDALWMGTCEVTWEEFNHFAQSYRIAKQLDREMPKDNDADAVSLPTPLYQEKLGPVLEWGTNGKMPAVCMTQFAAKQYTKWLSKRTGKFYRLPTEAEWEYAARAGSTAAYSFGDSPKTLDDYAWHGGNSDERYHEVGKKKPNAWGLYDMHGNVCEWVIDGYDKDHYKRLDERRSQQGGKPVAWAEAIHWPLELDPRVVRGGHFESSTAACRSAARWFSDKSWKAKDPQLPKSIWWQTDIPYVGFRIVRPAKEPSEKEKLRYWDADLDSIREVLKNDLQARMLVEEAKAKE